MKLLVDRGPRLEKLERYREWEFEEHRGLLEAVRARNPDLAADLMREHLDGVLLYHARLDWSIAEDGE
jgi:DNA-binding GntR family transcriptional regulator